MAFLFGKSRGGHFLSPLRGLFHFALVTHGLRRGLHSFAASRLGASVVSASLVRSDRDSRRCTRGALA